MEWLRKRDYLDNLDIHILDSNSYESTGGQNTCSDSVDFNNITKCTIWDTRENVEMKRVELDPEEITRRFYAAINTS